MRFSRSTLPNTKFGILFLKIDRKRRGFHDHILDETVVSDCPAYCIERMRKTGMDVKKPTKILIVDNRVSVIRKLLKKYSHLLQDTW